ncbi:L,D-transpeptidase [Roseibium denhamense]|uniref:Peptidoglycan binding domain-containing protein n=1 Tax=Roseibium denhamense TaxID=76305 RepID=A0ABY1P629_9HYPH|nr:L,D-transpeptidase [Roseibium denhamense]SMP25741.1 Putative peptidoglycan binding domain-containing protein [Roseibium denhamense]
MDLGLLKYRFTPGKRLMPATRLAGAAFLSAALTAGALARDGEPDTTAPVSEHPLHMLVSINDQSISVYRGTELINTSPISSGKRGHSTPTGVFSILEKRRKHFSNLYDNAPMPFMQRLTWSGIALHVGKLPGYPASHGCIRLPRDFAMSIYKMTERGMHVVVTKDPSVPARIQHAVLPQPFSVRTEVASLAETMINADPALRGAIQVATVPQELPAVQPENPHFDQPLRMIITPVQPEGKVRTLQRLLNQLGYNAGPVDGVVGRKTRAAIRLYQEGAEMPITGNITDRLVSLIHGEAGYQKPHNAMLRVRRKFRDIYQARVTLKYPDTEIGTHVFTALDFEQGDRSAGWMAVDAEGGRGGSAASILDRLEIPDDVAAKLSRMLTPGTSLTITDRSFQRNTGLGTDFVVITR